MVSLEACDRTALCSRRDSAPSYTSVPSPAGAPEAHHATTEDDAAWADWTRRQRREGNRPSLSAPADGWRAPVWTRSPPNHRERVSAYSTPVGSAATHHRWTGRYVRSRPVPSAGLIGHRQTACPPFALASDVPHTSASRPLLELSHRRGCARDEPGLRPVHPVMSTPSRRLGLGCRLSGGSRDPRTQRLRVGNGLSVGAYPFAQRGSCRRNQQGSLNSPGVPRSPSP